jgi:hypothetical protein
LFEYGDWDTFILQDALKLLRYTLDNLFGGGDISSVRAKGLGVAYKVCKKRPSHKNDKAATAFYKARKAANVAYDALIKQLEVDGPLSDDFTKVSPDDKISTATFFELLFRNEAQKIMRTECEHTMTEFCKSSYLINKPISSNITLILVFDTAEITLRFYKSHNKIEKQYEDASVEQSWHPATIAIVQDKTTRLVFTGATKAQAVGIPELQAVGYNTTVMRLGKKFRKEIDKSSGLFESSIRYDDRENDRPPHWFKNLPMSSTTFQGRQLDCPDNRDPPIGLDCRDFTPDWVGTAGLQPVAKHRQSSLSLVVLRVGIGRPWCLGFRICKHLPEPVPHTFGCFN